MPLSGQRHWMLARVLVLALLFAQSGAVIHAYSHFSDDPGERQGIARSCSFCLASSQLQHAAGPPALDLPVRTLAWATIVATPACAAVPSSPSGSYRSRAPPSFV
jgi:hypothetical protein